MINALTRAVSRAAEDGVEKMYVDDNKQVASKFRLKFIFLVSSPHSGDLYLRSCCRSCRPLSAVWNFNFPSLPVLALPVSPLWSSMIWIHRSRPRLAPTILIFIAVSYLPATSQPCWLQQNSAATPAVLYN